MKLKQVIKWLEEARDMATMETMELGMGKAGEELTKTVRESTRLYRETWIIPQIDAALEELKREVK